MLWEDTVSRENKSHSAKGQIGRISVSILLVLRKIIKMYIGVMSVSDKQRKIWKTFKLDARRKINDTKRFIGRLFVSDKIVSKQERGVSCS